MLLAANMVNAVRLVRLMEYDLLRAQYHDRILLSEGDPYRSSGRV
jgi:hypothetical protein